MKAQLAREILLHCMLYGCRYTSFSGVEYCQICLSPRRWEPGTIIGRSVLQDALDAARRAQTEQ